MPKQLKKNNFQITQKCEKNTKSQYGKMLDQKKIRAFHIHSDMSRHETPKQLKKYFLTLPNILSLEIEKCRTKKKVGHSASTQTQVDTKCSNS
jgi:hypothetical protein